MACLVLTMIESDLKLKFEVNKRPKKFHYLSTARHIIAKLVLGKADHLKGRKMRIEENIHN